MKKDKKSDKSLDIWKTTKDGKRVKSKIKKKLHKLKTFD